MCGSVRKQMRNNNIILIEVSQVDTHPTLQYENETNLYV